MSQFLWSDVRQYAVTTDELERDLPGVSPIMQEYTVAHMHVQIEMLRARLAGLERAPYAVLHAVERFQAAEQEMHRKVLPALEAAGPGTWTIYVNWRDEILAMDVTFTGVRVNLQNRLAVESGTPTFDLGLNQGPPQP